MNRFLFAILAVPMALVLLGTPGEGGDKTSPWKPFLSAEAYKELSQRSVKAIEGSAKSGAKNALAKIEVEALILAGYTLSVKNAGDDDTAMMRGAALQALKAKDLKKLGEFGAAIKSAPKASTTLNDVNFKDGLADLMEIFRNKAKGGEGLHAELHYQPKIKNLNGIEALLGALSAKKLSDDNLAKVSKELPLLAARIAVVGSLTHEFTPTKDANKWREYSVQMREGSIALAEAAQKKNGAGVLTAAQSLEASCTQCHRDFKNK